MNLDALAVNRDLALLHAYYLPGHVMLMKTTRRLAALLWVVTAYNYGQTTSIRSEDLQAAAAPNGRVAQFDVTDTTIIETPR